MEIIDKIESIIEDGEISKAIEIVESNIDKIGIVGCEYFQGRICNIIDDYTEAERHLKNALQGKPFDKVIYAELADVYEKSGKLLEAEHVYEKLINMEENGSKGKWAIYTYIADLFKRQKKWLKLENIGSRLSDEYPNSYMGRHLLFETSLEKGKIIQCEVLLDSTPDFFKNNIVYILDCASLCKKKNDYDSLFILFDKYSDLLDESFVIREKIKIYITIDDYKRAEENIYRLAIDYGDIEALISLMILLVSKERSEDSIFIGKYLLKNIDKDDIHYIYLVKVVSIMSKYRLCVIKNIYNASQLREDINDLIKYMEDNLYYEDDIMKFWCEFRDELYKLE